MELHYIRKYYINNRVCEVSLYATSHAAHNPVLNLVKIYTAKYTHCISKEDGVSDPPSVTFGPFGHIQLQIYKPNLFCSTGTFGTQPFFRNSCSTKKNFSPV